MFTRLVSHFPSNMKKILCVFSLSRKNCLIHITMMLILNLCFTLTFAHTVNGSPGYGVLCPISDTEYIDTNQNTVNEYYECPDPAGDPLLTMCCEDEEPRVENRNHEDLILSIIKGYTKHKCCLPPVPLDSVLKVKLYLLRPLL